MIYAIYTLIQSWSRALADDTVLRVLSYITVRSACALFVSFLVSLLVGPACIRWLERLKLGQQVRQFKTADTQQFNIHQHKAGTPTMGGLLIIVATLVSVLLFCRLTNSYVWVVTVVMLAGGALGFADDYLKISRKDHKGVLARKKLVVQIVLGLAVGLFLYRSGAHTYYAYKGIRGDTHLLIPFFKDLYPALGIFFVFWVALAITATSNAVNLTDGLDGLAIGTTAFVSLPYLAIAYIASHFRFSGYLYVPHVPQTGELCVFLAALLGASMGFLWFNAHPAQVFMGDTGSLSLGAVLGTIAVLCKQELLLVLIGGIFVVEALSVMIQVGSYKWRGKRVLLMSPLHNHYVKLGMDEAKIIARFLIVAALLAIFGVSTLKLR
ncbi:phospho-N-acetylmuramoyl-pentapeptide-transferase [Candidatus Sumerlaeota bacterium]|nr:phospho-N-acetylmuramoyl-pentapeptide-transferase [Candidatus Sumerlaeota bacterium]